MSKGSSGPNLGMYSKKGLRIFVRGERWGVIKRYDIATQQQQQEQEQEQNKTVTTILKCHFDLI